MHKVSVIEICRIAQESFSLAIEAADRSGDRTLADKMRLHSQFMVDNCNACQLHTECSHVAWCQGTFQRVLLPRPTRQ